MTHFEGWQYFLCVVIFLSWNIVSFSYNQFSKRKQNFTQLRMHINVYVDLFYFLELDIYYNCIRLLIIHNYDYVAYVRISCINVCADVITVFILFYIVHLVIFCNKL
jgi:hypothetical protein